MALAVIKGWPEAPSSPLQGGGADGAPSGAGAACACGEAADFCPEKMLPRKFDTPLPDDWANAWPDSSIAATMIAAALLFAGPAFAQSSGGNGVSNFFGNIFSGPKSTTAPPAQAATGTDGAPSAPPPWSGEDGASGHPLMTASAIREAAANFNNCVAAMWPDAARRQRGVEFEHLVEMILDHALVAPGDEDEMLDAGLLGLVVDILNQRLVDDGQHFLRHRLGGGQDAGAETGDREDGFTDFHGMSRALEMRNLGNGKVL